MVRPYLNKSDHEEYLRQFKAERNKRLRKRMLIAAFGCVVLVGIYFSIFAEKNPISDSFPAYLGGEVGKEEVVENSESKEMVKSLAENDSKGKLEEIGPEILDANAVAIEAQIEDIGSTADQTEQGNIPSISNELEESESQNSNEVNTAKLTEVARGPITEKVVERSGMQKNPEFSKASILFSAEKMPKFPGGYSALKKYIKKKLVVPEATKQQKIAGTVQVQFVVEVNGSIRNARIAKGLGYGCDEAALSLVQGMPNWIPGKHNGEEVAVYYNLPVKFSAK
ncbi:MAG: energy transducer TonB [Bacteroidota bacterium]